MKFLIITSISIFLWGVSIAAEYRVPQAAWSVSAADIDLDGDMDIVIGHSKNNDWSGISFLYNNNSVFTYTDSLYLNGEHRNIWMDTFDNNNYIDLVTRCYNCNATQKARHIFLPFSGFIHRNFSHRDNGCR